MQTADRIDDLKDLIQDNTATITSNKSWMTTYINENKHNMKQVSRLRSEIIALQEHIDIAKKELKDLGATLDQENPSNAKTEGSI